MAAKKPFVNYSGTLQELATGDTVTGLGGTLVAYKANGTQDNIDLLDGGGITVLPVAQGGTGAATGPAALISLGAREVLTAARTYYVATTGSDSNNGLTAGAPFLTIQKAVDVVCSLDMSIYQVTIQVANGTYTGSVVLKAYLGALAPTIQGNVTTPANCIVSVTSGHCFASSVYLKWYITGFKLTTATSGMCFRSDGAYITFSAIDFGAAASPHIWGTNPGAVAAVGNYTISGSASSHIQMFFGATCIVHNITVTITGTPAFPGGYIVISRSGCASAYGCTFSGSATGKRYDIALNSVCFVNGAATTYLPGDVAGTTATGGQYA